MKVLELNLIMLVDEVLNCNSQLDELLHATISCAAMCVSISVPRRDLARL